MTTSPHSDAAAWASTLATRLRAVQASFADVDGPTRQGYLADEVRGELAKVPAGRRQACLDALAERFPAWDARQSGVAAVADVPVAGGALGSASPSELVDRLIDAGAGLPEAERHVLVQRMVAGGFGTAPGSGGGSGPGTEVVAELWKRVGRPGTASPHPDRTVKLLLALADVFLALDQFGWTLWKQINPKSIYRKEAEFAKLLAPYLAGDAEVSTEQIRQPLERTRKLLAALVGAVGRAGGTFARKHTTTFAPDGIEDSARQEKKTFESLEAASWKKYKELYREGATEQMLEANLMEAVAKAAEDLISGRGR